MAILNYGSYYSYRKKDNASDTANNEAKARPKAFDRMKEDWQKRDERCFEHRCKENNKG